MASKKKAASEKPDKETAERQPRKTQRLNVWVLPDQMEWLKKESGGPSAAVRALVSEAMNMDRLKESLVAKKKPAPAKKAAKK